MFKLVWALSGLTVLAGAPTDMAVAAGNLPTAGTGGNAVRSMTLSTGSYISQSASEELKSLCTGDRPFPQQWTWYPSAITGRQPRAATKADNLIPKIEQYRDGKLIASYKTFASTDTCKANLEDKDDPKTAAETGCGPFGLRAHIDLFRLWADGDKFLVYPAVYDGPENNLFLGPRGDRAGGISKTFVPHNVTIQGVTQNGIRPVILDGPVRTDSFVGGQALVYLGESYDTVIDNIDLDGSGRPKGNYGMAGVYLNGVHSITLNRMRIVGFEVPQANGIFGTANNTGTVTLDQIELSRDGGFGTGLEHNIYINHSNTDKNYTVHMKNSWSHDAYRGHTFKSRAQVNVLEGNYFQGGVPQGGVFTQAENYLVDIPEGGRFTLRNNILVKNASGLGSNGVSATFAVEKVPDGRPLSIRIENNTFVAFAKNYEPTHQNYPFFFLDHKVPSDPTFVVPSSDVVIARNVFVGYCPAGYKSYAVFMDYRGDLAVTAAFSELNKDFSLNINVVGPDRSIIGTPAYRHPAMDGKTRKAASIGAVDFMARGSRATEP